MTNHKTSFQTRFTTTAALILLSLFSQTSVFAQSGAGEIQGQVVDQSGQAMAHAVVTVTRIDTGASKQVFTDDHGRFAAPALPAGRYEVTARFDGYAARRQEELVLHHGARVTLRLELRKALSPETLTIGLKPAELETERTHASFLVDAQQVETLPTKDRQYLRLAQLVPAVTTNAATGGLSVMDQSSALNRVVIDGFDHTSSMTGEPQGGVGVSRAPAQVSQAAIGELQVNVNGYPAETGRAGAGVITVATKSGTNAMRGSAFEFFGDRALNASRTIDGVREPDPPYRSNQFGGVIGGPIVRSHDFFLLSYEGLRRTATLSQDQDLALARVDHQFAGTGRLTGRYLDQQFTGAPFESRTRSVGLSLATSLGRSVVNEARAQRSTSRDAVSLAQDFATRRIQAADSLSFVSGGHSMKIGADALVDANTATLGGPGAMPTVHPDVNSYSAFVQDAWRAGSSVTVDLGVRYDLQTIPSLPRDTNNWAPRVGVAWAGSEHSILRAGYGVFYGMTPAIIPAMTALYRGADTAVVDPGFQSPQVQHANVGWEWEKYRVATAGVTYLFARGMHLPRAEDINVGTPRPFPGLNRVASYRSNGESIYNGITYHMRMRFFQNLYYTASYTFARADDTASGVAPLLLGTAADKRVLPLTTATERRPADNDQHHRVVVGAMYDTSALAGTRTGVMKALIAHWSLGVVYTLQSGQPYSSYVDGDINGDGNAFNDLAPATARNQYRLPVQASFDPRIARDFHVGQNGKLSLIWEAFNVTNRPNYVAVEDRLLLDSGAARRRSPIFGQAAMQADGRVMQLAVRVAF
jgi:hypothetical protein